jgi:Carboxypeptidase regulatory-like domain/TonB dependent receptor
MGNTSRLVIFAIIGLGAIANAQDRQSLQLSGVVVDATDAVLPGAVVELTNANSSSQTITDGRGQFSFDAAAVGKYQLRVSLDGFRSKVVEVSIAVTQAKRPLRVVLDLAEVHQEVLVNGADTGVTNTPASNADAVIADENTIDALPIFNNDVVGSMSRFLDPGSVGGSGPTVLINGVVVDSVDVAASAIQQIKVNQNPYSATFGQPGRGRIEIVTKPASQKYQGESSFVFRDSRLDARNALATTRPREQRRIFDGLFGGPLAHSASTSFVVSGTADNEDREAIVFATGLQGPIRDTVQQPYRHALGSVAVTHQRAKSTFAIRTSYLDDLDGGRGVGGTTLGSAGTTYSHHEFDFTFNQQMVLRPTWLNQFQLFIGKELETTTSTSPAQGIVVNGAFTGGGAQVDVRHPELHIHLSENAGLTKGSHFLQLGLQVPDWTQRGIDERSDFAGTYYFASLAAYASGRPYAFVQQQGNGRVTWKEKLVSAYANDDWHMRSKATLSLGIRYDWSDYFADYDTIAPRLSLAFNASKATVIRAGAGVFYDKVGPAPEFDVLESQPGHLERTLLRDPAYPVDASALAAGAPSAVRFAPNIQVPSTMQYSVGVERQLGKRASISAMYYGADGTVLRSRDINAPLPPDYSTRPNAAFGDVREIESEGRQRSNALQLTLRGRSARALSGQIQYTLSRTLNDSGGLNWFPANDYDLRGEWGRADFDRRHRLLGIGDISATRQLTIGVAATVESGLPYTELLGVDAFNNGRGTARPVGVGRNTLQGAGLVDIDLRVVREFKLGTSAKRTIGLTLDAFNLFNNVNYSDYVGTVTSSLFSRPVTALPPRELQLSARIKF